MILVKVLKVFRISVLILVKVLMVLSLVFWNNCECFEGFRISVLILVTVLKVLIG